ncbi:Uncharacterized protein PAE221_02635 [Pseudomonas aeruginosa]|nr:hypothetical protein PA96_3312 [Pseudomonas aeruginosa PA96]CEI77042.1 Uncharacterized protein PAE221_02635 [Pseudomonas aeruginosa]
MQAAGALADQTVKVGKDQDDCGGEDDEARLPPSFWLLVQHGLSAFLVVGWLPAPRYGPAERLATQWRTLRSARHPRRRPPFRTLA